MSTPTIQRERQGLNRLHCQSAADQRAQQVARYAAAVGFYKAFAGYQIKVALLRVVAIDFSQPLAVEELPAGSVLQQWVGQARGRFYSNVGETANRLGVAEYYVDQHGVERQKTAGLFATRQAVTVLKSVAAPCVDSWSSPARPCRRCGGGAQFFVPKRELNALITPINDPQRSVSP